MGRDNRRTKDTKQGDSWDAVERVLTCGWGDWGISILVLESASGSQWVLAGPIFQTLHHDLLGVPRR
jgi:hypothetical protein